MKMVKLVLILILILGIFILAQQVISKKDTPIALKAGWNQVIYRGGSAESALVFQSIQPYLIQVYVYNPLYNQWMIPETMIKPDMLLAIHVSQDCVQK